MVRQWQEFFYEERYNASPMINPDFCKIADAYGIPAIRVTKRDEIEDSVAQGARARGRPRRRRVHGREARRGVPDGALGRHAQRDDPPARGDAGDGVIDAADAFTATEPRARDRAAAATS